MIILQLEPSWRATEYSVVLLTQKLALYMDSLNETHAMNKKIENSDDITKFSIDVVYYKSKKFQDFLISKSCLKRIDLFEVPRFI